MNRSAGRWFGVMIPSGAPREVVNRLNTELRKIAQSKAVGDLLLGQGADALGTSAEEFAARIKSDIAKWAATIKAAGIRVE